MGAVGTPSKMGWEDNSILKIMEPSSSLVSTTTVTKPLITPRNQYKNHLNKAKQHMFCKSTICLPTINRKEATNHKLSSQKSTGAIHNKTAKPTNLIDNQTSINDIMNKYLKQGQNAGGSFGGDKSRNATAVTSSKT